MPRFRVDVRVAPAEQRQAGTLDGNADNLNLVTRWGQNEARALRICPALGGGAR